MDNPSFFTINHRKTIREAFKHEVFTKEQFVIVVDDEDNVIYEDNKCSCDKHLPVNY